MQGQIIKQVSNKYTVLCEKEILDCIPVGRFRHENITPMVGDYCIVDENKQIVKILTRKNELKRPVIANVDRALIITSVKEPSLSLLLLDKMIAEVTFNGIKPLIIFTKVDLLNHKELQEIKKLVKYYKKIGIEVFYNKEKFKLKRFLKGKTVVLVGQSGAGKSTLINKLNKKLKLETKPISKSLGRGVHTTRHTELYNGNNILIADTPGFSSLTFEKNDKKDLDSLFVEFRQNKCDFNDCLHINEKGCYIKKQVNDGKILRSRYDSYRKILEEVKK